MGASAGWCVVQADRALGWSSLGVRRWRAGAQEVDAARLVGAGRRRQRVRANSAGADSRQAAAGRAAGAVRAPRTSGAEQARWGSCGSRLMACVSRAEVGAGA
jgi:hypothetical protein